MVTIYEFASQQWQAIPDARDEIMDELEEEGKGQWFKEVETLLGEQLAAAQTEEQKEAWAENVVALITGVRAVREALGLRGGGSFGYNRGTKAYASQLAAQQKGKLEHEAGIHQTLYQPVDDKPSRIQQLLDKLRGRS